jgi:hypothetical protein
MGFTVSAAVGIPTLDSVGLMIFVLVLAAAGFLAVNRFVV